MAEGPNEVERAASRLGYTPKEGETAWVSAISLGCELYWAKVRVVRIHHLDGLISGKTAHTPDGHLALYANRLHVWAPYFAQDGQ